MGRRLRPSARWWARGTSSALHTYALLDGKLPAGSKQLFYRLRQDDTEGTASYSAVRSVAFSSLPGTLFSVYPNPAKAALTADGLSAGVAVEILDALGRRVVAATADASGSARLLLPAGVASGVYVVRSGQQAQRLVVE